MKQLHIGYDDNLGLAADFSEKIPCTTKHYHALSELIKDFSNNTLDAAFIPVGALPYIKKYKIISQAVLGHSHEKHSLKTYFVTVKNALPLQKIQHLVPGRVNEYCTTSYWAPLIYLMDHVEKGTCLRFQDTHGFEDLLAKTAQGQIEGAMVWDVILQKNPALTKKTHRLFSMMNLPAPVLIAKDNFPLGVIEKINQFESQDKESFFSGFRLPEEKSIKKFQAAMRAAIKHYGLRCDE